MGSQQVHQGDSAAPATPKIDNDDATMEIDPPNVEPVPSSAVSDAAAAASDDVSVEPTVVCCSQLGSLDLFTAESEPADDVVPAVANNESGEASEDPTAGDVMPQAAALAPEPEPDAPSETPAEAASARGPNVHRTPDELHLITPPSCSIHLNCNLALTKTDLDWPFFFCIVKFQNMIDDAPYIRQTAHDTHTHTHLTWFDFSFFYSSQNIFMVDRQDILNLTDTTDWQWYG